METHASSSTEPLELLRMTAGLVVHQTLYAAARLGIADLLEEGERDSADLAAALPVSNEIVILEALAAANC